MMGSGYPQSGELILIAAIMKQSFRKWAGGLCA